MLRIVVQVLVRNIPNVSPLKRHMLLIVLVAAAAVVLVVIVVQVRKGFGIMILRLLGEAVPLLYIIVYYAYIAYYVPHAKKRLRGKMEAQPDQHSYLHTFISYFHTFISYLHTFISYRHTFISHLHTFTSHLHTFIPSYLIRETRNCFGFQRFWAVPRSRRPVMSQKKNLRKPATDPLSSNASSRAPKGLTFFFPFSGGSLSLSKLPLLSAQGALLLAVLLGGELKVLQNAVHVERVVALPPHCHRGNIGTTSGRPGTTFGCHRDGIETQDMERDTTGGGGG